MLLEFIQCTCLCLPLDNPQSIGKKTKPLWETRRAQLTRTATVLLPLCLFSGLFCCVSSCLIFHLSEREREVWANPHMAQSLTARGERNRPNTSVECMSFTCRNTRVSVTQQAEGLHTRTLPQWISLPLRTRVSRMWATFLSFTLLIGSPVWAHYKSHLTDSFVFYASNKGLYFPNVGHSPKHV